MKKIYTLIVAFLLVISTAVSYAAEAVPNALPEGSKISGEPVPGATLRKDIADAVKKGNENVEKAAKFAAGSAGAAKKAAEKAERNSANILGAVNKMAPGMENIEKSTGQVEKSVGGLEKSLEKVGEDLKKIDTNITETAKITVENGKEINWIGSVLGVLLVLGFAVVIVLLRNGQNAVASDIGRLSTSVANIAVDVAGIPNETAKLVKQLEPEVFSFTLSDGSKWEYTTPIVSGEYVSLKILDDSIQKLITNPNDIPLYTNGGAGKVRNFTGKVLEKHFVHNQFSGDDPKNVAQRDIIVFSIGKSLKEIK